MIDRIIFLTIGVAISGVIFAIIKFMSHGDVVPNLDKEIYDQSAFISQASSDGLVLLDSTGNIKIINQAASDLTGWPINDAINLNYKSVIRIVDDKNQLLPDVINPFTYVITNHINTVNQQIILSNKLNQSIPISMSISKLDTDNESKQMLVILKDVTGSKKRDQERSEFISTASHEMRTPIASIEGFLSLATMTATDPKIKSYIDKAHEQTGKLGKLFEDLLTSAKVDDGLMKPNPTTFNVNDLISQMIPTIKNQTDAKNLTLHFNNGSDTNQNGKSISPLFKITADPKQVAEILKQLVSNAVKFTEAGSVAIGINGDSDTVQIYVQDTGKGIASTDIPHLFQRFYRLDNSETRDNGGTGLGLFIGKSLTDLNNGKIWIESEVGKGTTVRVNFARSRS